MKEKEREGRRKEKGREGGREGGKGRQAIRTANKARLVR